MIKKFSIVSLALAAALAISPAAKADNFGFTFNDPSSALSATGTVSGTFEGAGTWLLTSGSGTFTYGLDSGSFTLIPNPNGPGASSLSPSGYFAYDDLYWPFSPSGEFVDGDGILFDFAGTEVDLFYSLGDLIWYDNLGDNGIGTLDLTSSTATPEPGTWLLMLTGMALLAGLVVRSRRTASAVLAA